MHCLPPDWASFTPSARARPFITSSVTYSLLLFCCKHVNATGSRNCTERKFFKDNTVLEPWGRNCAGDLFLLPFFLKNKYFSSLINVSLHPKFFFSICLAQTLKEQNKASREARWQEWRAEMGEAGAHLKHSSQGPPYWPVLTQDQMLVLPLPPAFPCIFPQISQRGYTGK